MFRFDVLRFKFSFSFCFVVCLELLDCPPLIWRTMTASWWTALVSWIFRMPTISLNSRNWDKLLGKCGLESPDTVLYLIFSSFLHIIDSRLTATNIEEKVVNSYLVHETNCIVSMPEFALRLQISIDNKTTADIFRIFDTVRLLFVQGIVSKSIFNFHLKLQNMCGTIDFRAYLLCALFLIKQNQPTIDLIHVASKMYDDCGNGPRNLSRKALHNVLSHTMATSVDDTIDIFSQIDTTQKGYITIGGLCEKRSWVPMNSQWHFISRWAPIFPAK